MYDEEKEDKSFVIAVKLATMRSCMIHTDEKKAFRGITGNCLSLFSTALSKSTNKNRIESDLKDLFDNVNMLITSKIDRIVEFIENLRKLDQEVTEYLKTINGIQQRWENSNTRLKGFDLSYFTNTDQKDIDPKITEFQQNLVSDFSVYDELLKFEGVMQVRSKDIINVIVKSNPKTEIDGLAEVLLDDKP